MGNERQRWRIPFRRSKGAQNHVPDAVPDEFLCSLSGLIMADPVIVISGHTFERSILNACSSLSFTPPIPCGGTGVADFSVVIPNLALKAAIENWCRRNSVDPPEPLDSRTALEIVAKLIDKLQILELPRTQSDVSIQSSEEFVATTTSSATPPPSRVCPSYYSLPSSCEAEVSSIDEEELFPDLTNPAIDKQEEALVRLRELSRTRKPIRDTLCTPRLLSAVKSLITSKHQALQVNATALLVNISLENRNKVKIVRSGFIQPLVELLNDGFPESRDHAASALFSLSTDDQNKAAIGVLGALPPLLQALSSDSPATRNDAALALYHLSMVESNRVKLTKLGAAQILLAMVKTSHMLNVMLVLRNLACSPDGRAAMLDGGAVECFMELLRCGKTQSSSAVRNSCLSAVYGLSYGGRRFKGAAMAAGAEEVMMELLSTVNERGKEMIRRVLNVVKEEVKDEEEVNWEELLDMNQGGGSSGFNASC